MSLTRCDIVMVSVGYQFDNIYNHLGDGFVGLQEYIILIGLVDVERYTHGECCHPLGRICVLYKDKEKTQAHYLIEST